MRAYWIIVCLLICAGACFTADGIRVHDARLIADGVIFTFCVLLAAVLIARMKKKEK